MPNEQIRHIIYKLKAGLSGQKIADSVDIEVDASGFTGALADMTVTDVQLLANFIDGLMIDGGNPGMIHANMVDVDTTALTGLLSNVGNVQTALNRIDATGLGAQFREITGSFNALYSEGSENTNTWYGGRQTVSIRVRPTANGQYTFTMPRADAMTEVFDDLASKGLGEVYTLTLEYAGGNTGFVNRNRLTVQNASVSNGFAQGTFPTVLAQGQSATFRIERTGGVTGSWERLGIQQAVNPAPTFGEFVFQSRGWSNADGSFLPSGGDVLKGYAFPVVGSNPNDGTLRQGLLDSGVSDRVIHDGDYVVWTADSFTAWTNGDDWFVLPINQLELLTRQQGNFLAQVTEIDARVDVGFVSGMGSEALVWLSENPFARAPFLTPSTDTGSAPDGNPRPGDDYHYVGGRENKNAMQQFTFSQNRFNNYMTVGISPNFISAHDVNDIVIRIVEEGTRNVLAEYNLGTDFEFVDDDTFTNSTVRHYRRNSTVNYPFLATIEVVLTQVVRHFRLNPQSVDVTQNVRNLLESQLSPDVVAKLNRPLPDDSERFQEIEPRLMSYINVPSFEPDIYARFLDSTGSDPVPSNLDSFSVVSASNPRFTGGDVALFVAVDIRNDNSSGFTLLVRPGTNNEEKIPLSDSHPQVSVLESVNVDGITYFVYRVTGLTSGRSYEVERVFLHRVLREQNDIENLQKDVAANQAALKHAALNLADALVNVLQHNVTVTEETNATKIPTDYNKQLANTDTQIVFDEPTIGTVSGGTLNSDAIIDSPVDRRRKKLLYLQNKTFGNSAVVSAWDGTTARDLIRYQDGYFYVKQFVDAIPAGQRTEQVYPAPSNLVSGHGIWHTIRALTLVNGVPTPLADELFYTRNLSGDPTNLTINHRAHANNNLFGSGVDTLVGFGGNTDAIVNSTVSDGSESVTLESFWQAQQRRLRESITETVFTGLATVNDVQTQPVWERTVTVPATPATVRDIRIDHVNTQNGLNTVFAFKDNGSGKLVIVSEGHEIDTNFDFTTLFGAGETGHLTALTDTAVFYDYDCINPIPSTVTDLKNHSSLQMQGLFTLQYTHSTFVDLGVQLRVPDQNGTLINVGQTLRQYLDA